MLRFLLYFAAGIATAIPVFLMLGWAVWGAPISPFEYVSLLGSLTLVIAAFITISQRHLAAQVALAGACAIWSFYLPGIVGIVRVKLTDQRVSVRVMKWTLSDDPLSIDDSIAKEHNANRLSDVELSELKSLGITGKLTTDSNGEYGHGKKAHATIIISHQVNAPANLPQPDVSNVIYVQRGDDWQKYPPDAKTLKRTIRIEPLQGDAKQTMVMIELANGAMQGSGVCCWHNGAATAGK